MIGGGRDLAEPDIGHTEFHPLGLLRFIVVRRGDQHAQLRRGIAAENDHRPVRNDRVDADNVDLRVGGTININCNHPIKTALVEKTQGIAVTD